jgi:hypothetical protein
MLQGQLTRHRILDTLGGIFSIGCAIHCLLVPVLTIFWPVLGSSFFADESFHYLLLYFVVPIALVSLLLGHHRHKDFKILSFGATGLIILTILTLTAEEECAHCISTVGSSSLAFWTWSTEVLIRTGGMILGSTLLCMAHWMNYNACRSQNCSH